MHFWIGAWCANAHISGKINKHSWKRIGLEWNSPQHWARIFQSDASDIIIEAHSDPICIAKFKVGIWTASSYYSFILYAYAARNR